MAMPLISKLYGLTQDTKLSGLKVKKFIQKFEINIDDYRPGSLSDQKIESSYKSFNEFFIREFKPSKRSFDPEPTVMPAFSEARYFGHESWTTESLYPVKGKNLNPRDLLQNDEYASLFHEGPLLIARLCPVDYHRFHVPDDAKLKAFYPIDGALHSVNPLALKEIPSLMLKNERHVSILETTNFGTLAYIEVGAVFVGKIVQSFASQDELTKANFEQSDYTFKRGDEKGYFLFGGSTVVVLGEKGKWKPSKTICEMTSRGIETYVHLGDPVAQKI